MSTPLVSVVMPVHDAGRFLESAVRSILEQSVSDLELIAIDDGSTDGSGDVLERLGSSDPRVRVVRQEQAGITATINRGWTLACADYVARMDADDLAHPRRLERQLAVLDARPTLAGIGCSVRYIDDEGRSSTTWRVPSGPLVPWSLLFGTALAHPTVVLRRSIVGDDPPYDTSIWYAQDYALWIDLATRAELDNVPDVLLDRRLHDQNVSATRTSEQSASARATVERATLAIAGVELSDDDVRAVIASSDPLTAEGPVLAHVSDVVVRLLRGYLERHALDAPARSLVRRDAARRLWNAALAIRRQQPSRAAGLAAAAVLVRLGLR